MIDLQPKRIAVDVNTSESGTRHHVPSDLAIADRVGPNGRDRPAAVVKNKAAYFDTIRICVYRGKI